jgi:SAM-dependent methyltransferase
VSQTAESERHWWDGLSPEEKLINTAGVPPYPVVEVGAAVIAELRPKHMPRLLDLGCGLGRLTAWIADGLPDGEITAVDISPSMIKAAEKRKNIVYRVGDGRYLPESCGWFDGAYSITMFQHLPPGAVCIYILDVAAHLRPGARFVCNASIGSVSAFLQHDLKLDDLMAMMDVAGLHKVTSFEQFDWTWFVGEKA